MSHAMTLELNREHERIRRRTRRGVIWSFVAHLVVLVLMAMQQHLAPEPLRLTEITWLDPVEAAPAPAPPAVAQPEPAKPEPVAVTQKTEETVHFKRAESPAPAEPKPQDARVVQDRLQERLASLRQNAPTLPQAVATTTAPRMSRPTRAPILPESSPVDMKRGQSPTPAPVSLARQSHTPAPRLELAAAPEREVTAAQITEDTSPLVREIAGAQLMGPVADRELVSYEVPEYPAVAMREGREGSVTLRFIVRPNGSVKENVLVEATSGYAPFDHNAVDALRQWRFEALPHGSVGEQWGTITFHFKLSLMKSE
jgi:TonB family protein